MIANLLMLSIDRTERGFYRKKRIRPEIDGTPIETYWPEIMTFD